MKDYLKTLAILLLVALAFYSGRNFGIRATHETEAMKTLKSENFQCQNAQSNFYNLKSKIQRLLDSSDLKKADELLGQIIPIFLTDLNLEISDAKQTDLQEGKNRCSLLGARYNDGVIQDVKLETTSNLKTEYKKGVEALLENQWLHYPIKNEKRFKIDEELLLNADSNEEIRKIVEKLEVARIDSLLERAPKTSFEQSRQFFGSYRGTIYDVGKKIYGTLVMQIYATPQNTKPIGGYIKIYRDGVEQISAEVNTSSIGYSPVDYSATLVPLREGNTYLQIYKMHGVTKIAGLFYERLPRGTTKTIGVFVLSRTDFEE